MREKKTLKNIVVWGLGGNGRNIIEVLKHIGIKAIVESNPNKRELKEYEGIPLISPQEYYDKYTDNYLIVSMMDYEGVLNQLKERGIKKYFLYTEREYTFYTCLFIKNKEIEKILDLNKETNYCISHIDMVSALLFDYLKCAGYDVTICDRMNREIIEQLLSDGIVDKDDITLDVTNRFVLAPEDVNDIILEKDRKKIRKFKDIHKGESVFIVATGPSLRMEDLERIRKAGYKCVSMNGIYEVFSDTGWRPDYYVASDALMIERLEKNNIENVENIDAFFSDNYIYCPKLRKRDNSYFFCQKQNKFDMAFSNDFSKKVYSGKTVAYACMQLVLYMGFETIFLIGFNHWDSKKHVYRENRDDYNVKYYTFDIDCVNKAYECAKEYAQLNNIKILNATHGGNLEVFERVDFDSLVE